MKPWLVAIGILSGLLMVGIGLTLTRRAQPLPNKSNKSSLGGTMQLTSPVFQNNQSIPAQYSCDGENTNPPLQITGVPKSAQSLVLIVDDPDAPSGDFVHWTVWNLNPDTQEILESGPLPAGAVEGLTDFGRSGYGGPCPPSGIHRYFFKLYALDTTLDIPRSSVKKDIEQAMPGHILEQTQLIGLYSRKS